MNFEHLISWPRENWLAAIDYWESAGFRPDLDLNIDWKFVRGAVGLGSPLRTAAISHTAGNLEGFLRFELDLRSGIAVGSKRCYRPHLYWTYGLKFLTALPGVSLSLRDPRKRRYELADIPAGLPATPLHGSLFSGGRFSPVAEALPPREIRESWEKAWTEFLYPLRLADQHEDLYGSGDDSYETDS
jgi:hypothetical protein